MKLKFTLLMTLSLLSSLKSKKVGRTKATRASLIEAMKADPSTTKKEKTRSLVSKIEVAIEHMKDEDLPLQKLNLSYKEELNKLKNPNDYEEFNKEYNILKYNKDALKENIERIVERTTDFFTTKYAEIKTSTIERVKLSYNLSFIEAALEGLEEVDEEIQRYLGFELERDACIPEYSSKHEYLEKILDLMYSFAKNDKKLKSGKKLAIVHCLLNFVDENVVRTEKDLADLKLFDKLTPAKIKETIEKYTRRLKIVVKGSMEGLKILRKSKEKERFMNLLINHIIINLELISYKIFDKDIYYK